MYRCSRSRFHGKETFTRLRPERLASYNIWWLRAARRPKTPSETPSSATELSIRIPDAGNRPPVRNVTQSATAFGISRPTYYQAEADFQRDGLFGLLPEKRGPRQGHKLTPEVLDFAVHLRASDPSSRLLDLAAAIRERFAINAHPRSIELQVDC